MNILIVDDHALVRKGLKQTLESNYKNVNIQEVATGNELREISSSQHWDVIISDLSMPGVSAAEVIRKIKQHAPSTPLLIFSAHSADQYAIPALQMGASCYLNKEANMEEIVRAIDYILTGKKYLTHEVAELLADFVKARKQPRRVA